MATPADPIASEAPTPEPAVGHSWPYRAAVLALASVALFGGGYVVAGLLWIALDTAGLIVGVCLLVGAFAAVGVRWPPLRVPAVLAAVAMTPVMWLFFDVSLHGLLPG